MRTTTRWRRSAAVLAALVATGAHGAHPLLTEDAGVQGRGGWQLELNGERQRDPQVDASVVRATQQGNTLTYGVTDTLDVKADLPYVHHQGALDLGIGLKWRFYERGELAFAALGGVFLPTGNDEKGLGAGHTNVGAGAVASWVGERWEFHTHGAYRTNRNTLEQRESLWHASAAVMFRVLQPVRLLVDAARDTNPDPAAGALTQTVYGFIWSVTKDLDLDAGWRHGNTAAIDRAVLFGLTVRW